MLPYLRDTLENEADMCLETSQPKKPQDFSSLVVYCDIDAAKCCPTNQALWDFVRPNPKQQRNSKE